MAWQIDFDEEAVKDLEMPVVRRITTFLRERGAPLEDPRSIVEALKGSKLGEYWKYRVVGTTASSLASRTVPCASSP